MFHVEHFAQSVTDVFRWGAGWLCERPAGVRAARGFKKPALGAAFAGIPAGIVRRGLRPARDKTKPARLRSVMSRAWATLKPRPFRGTYAPAETRLTTFSERRILGGSRTAVFGHTT